MVATRCVNVIDATEPYTSKWLILSCICHLNFLKTKRSFHNLWVSVLRNKMGITHPFPLTTGLLRLGSWNHVFLNRSVPVDAHSTHNSASRTFQDCYLFSSEFTYLPREEKLPQIFPQVNQAITEDGQLMNSPTRVPSSNGDFYSWILLLLLIWKHNSWEFKSLKMNSYE